MGHSIQYYTFDENYNRKHIQEFADEEATREGDHRAPTSSREIRFLENKVCRNKDEAHEVIKKNDDGWYDQLAVKYTHYEKRKETKAIENLRARVTKMVNNLFEYKSKNAIKNRKSKFVGCTKCESRINKEYIKDDNWSWNKCPLCNEELSSKTVLDAVRTKEKNILDLQERLDEAITENNYKNKPKVKWLVKTEYNV